MKLTELNLCEPLLNEIKKLGWDDCTPIQEQAIPKLLDGKDVSGLAPTGTGKTGAFLIPMIERILRSQSEERKTLPHFTDWRARNFILVLVPTRELAEQIFDQFGKLGVPCGLRGISIYGGSSYEPQKEALRNGVEFVIATPGRLIDLYKEHLLDLKQVRAVIFDEADRMFDMGFRDDMSFILQRIPRERQLCLFSATLNFEVINIAYRFGAEPFEINLSRKEMKAENVQDFVFHCGQDEKPRYLLSLLRKENADNNKQAIVFTNFKNNVDRITIFLNNAGIHALGFSSLLSQGQRNKVIETFRDESSSQVLVATDVAARGLDVDRVDIVINFDLPSDPESYVHRIGRTGRAQKQGHAFSLVSDRDVDSLMRVEEYLTNKIASGYLEESELLKEIPEFPRSDYSSKPSFNDKGRPPRPPPRKDFNKGPRPQGQQQRDQSQQRDQGPRPQRQQNPRPAQSGNGQQAQKQHFKQKPQNPNQQQANGKKPVTKTQGSGQYKKPAGANVNRTQFRKLSGSGSSDAKPAAAKGFLKKLFNLFGG